MALSYFIFYLLCVGDDCIGCWQLLINPIAHQQLFRLHTVGGIVAAGVRQETFPSYCRVLWLSYKQIWFSRALKSRHGSQFFRAGSHFVDCTTGLQKQPARLVLLHPRTPPFTCILSTSNAVSVTKKKRFFYILIFWQTEAPHHLLCSNTFWVDAAVLKSADGTSLTVNRNREYIPSGW